MPDCRRGVDILLQMVGQDWALSPAPSHMPGQNDIMLVGVGTDALPDDNILNAILDGALIAISQTPITTADLNRRQAELTL